MRITLSNHSLFKLGGSETWVRTMYDELSKEHEVHVYTPIHQLWTDIPPFNPRLRYDLAIVNHTNCLGYLRQQNIGRIIFTSHGVIPQPERPEIGADVYVSVSEEVQAANLERGFESVVIRNPINTERFKPLKPTHGTLKNVLFLSNYGWKILETMATVGHEFDYVHIGGDSRVEETWEWIEWADLVIGLGRSVYESMSGGRNALVFDYQGADGIVTPESILKFRIRNCSGRTHKLRYTEDQLRAELCKYDASYGPQLRDYILENNNVETIAKEYLSL